MMLAWQQQNNVLISVAIAMHHNQDVSFVNIGVGQYENSSQYQVTIGGLTVVGLALRESLGLVRIIVTCTDDCEHHESELSLCLQRYLKQVCNVLYQIKHISLGYSERTEDCKTHYGTPKVAEALLLGVS